LPLLAGKDDRLWHTGLLARAIAQLYERHRKDQFAGREAEWAKLEYDICRARRRRPHYKSNNGSSSSCGRGSPVRWTSTVWREPRVSACCRSLWRCRQCGAIKALVDAAVDLLNWVAAELSIPRK